MTSGMELPDMDARKAVTSARGCGSRSAGMENDAPYRRFSESEYAAIASMAVLELHSHG